MTSHSHLWSLKYLLLLVISLLLFHYLLPRETDRTTTRGQPGCHSRPSLLGSYPLGSSCCHYPLPRFLAAAVRRPSSTLCFLILLLTCCCLPPHPCGPCLMLMRIMTLLHCHFLVTSWSMPEQNPCIADLNLEEQEGQPQWRIHIKRVVVNYLTRTHNQCSRAMPLSLNSKNIITARRWLSIFSWCLKILAWT